MKKWICLFGMMTCFLLCTISVRADAVWSPQDDFYEKHRDDCKYVDRQFIADGPDGVVILYESPESDKEVATWENGYQTWIQFTYVDKQGIVWGYPSDRPAMTGVAPADGGWMPMEYMKLVYDSISFMEEHRDQLEHQEGVLDESYEGEIYIWEYPGSKNKMSNSYMREYSSIYTDEEGHRWGFAMSNTYTWICLDNPTAEFEELYPNGAPQYEVEDD
ncbi:MAG: hypothetical protein K2H31_07895 [Lachnospiraceae bacterium]|nr:hypothetical protein [Lachnospiraceae bacterium]